VNSAQADSTDYNQLLPQITEKWESKHLFENNANRLGYALKDIDRNGTDELLIGLTNGEKWELFEVYYMNGNTPTPLFDRFWDTSFRMGTVINTYTDGSIMVFESSPGIVSYRLFQLSKENKEPTLIKKGEFVLISGKSGSGKSTLGSVMNGLIPHYYKGKMKGEAFASGKDISKLLLHKKQINYLLEQVKQAGNTVVPLKVYIKNGVAKLLIGVAKGKKNYDKRDALKQKDMKREIDRAMKERY